MLRYAILSLLVDAEMSGYELSRVFAGSVGYFWQAGHTQIYPELRRMEAAGLLEATDVAQQGKPDKRLYKTTPRGRDDLLDWIRTPTKPGPLRDPLMIRAFNFGRMPEADAIELLEEHKRMHRERLADYEAIRATLDRPGLEPGSVLSEHSGWALSLEAGIRYERMYAEWCDWTVEMLERSWKAADAPQ